MERQELLPNLFADSYETKDASRLMIPVWVGAPQVERKRSRVWLELDRMLSVHDCEAVDVSSKLYLRMLARIYGRKKIVSLTRWEVEKAERHLGTLRGLWRAREEARSLALRKAMK